MIDILGAFRRSNFGDTFTFNFLLRFVSRSLLFMFGSHRFVGHCWSIKVSSTLDFCFLPFVGPKHCHRFWWTRDNFILSNKHETKRKRHKQQSLCEARSAIAPHRISCHSLLLRCCSDQFPTPCTAEQWREEEKRNGSEFRTTKRLLSVDEKMIISHNLNFNLVWTVAAKASSLVSRNFFASRRIQFYEFLFDAYTFKSALIGAARVSSSLCQTKSKRDRQRTQSASEDKNKVINSHRTFNEWFVQL